MWSECTGRTRRSGRSVYTGNPTRTVRERYARAQSEAEVAALSRKCPAAVVYWPASAYHASAHHLLGRVHTVSGSVPDSSEPYASGRLLVGFAFTLLTTDPTRTVRVRFAVYTLRLLRDRL